MAEAEYTRGPWAWRQTNLPESSTAGSFYRNVRLGGDGPLRVGVMDRITRADAALIAAAPDLLSAAECVIEALGGPLPVDPANVIALLDSAVAKARGRADR